MLGTETELIEGSAGAGIGKYVKYIDRDDIVTCYLKSLRVPMSDELFIEYSNNNNKLVPVAGIDYCSEEDILTSDNIARHRDICNRLKIPYFVVYINGETYFDYRYVTDELKRITGYTIVYKACNRIAKQIIKYNNVPANMSEETYSYFLYFLRGKKKTEPIKDERFFKSSITYKKIFRERHAKYGDELKQTDVDAIIYSLNNPINPVMILEFKCSKSQKKAMYSSISQANLLKQIGIALDIPVFRIWHEEDNTLWYAVMDEYTGKVDINKMESLGVYFTDRALYSNVFASDLFHISATK